MATTYKLRIRSRHPSHNVLRTNKTLKFPKLIVYRLGSTSTSSINLEINSIESIKNSSNKLKMKALFKENNIPSPVYFTTPPIDEKVFPILAKQIYGSKGKGMVKLDTLEDLNNFLKTSPKNYYYEQYFSGAREYRIHVTHSECFYSCRKLRKKSSEDRWYFNSNNCVWITQYKRIVDENENFLSFSKELNPAFNMPENWNTIVQKSIEAIKSVGLDIGAVDVRMNKKEDFMILETNSAPSFGDITKLMYINQIPKVVLEKFNLK